jgi:transposase
MGQRARILTEIAGFDGWKVKDAFFESSAGARVVPVGTLATVRETRLVLVVERQWRPRCGQCGGPCHDVHERLPVRRWADLPWAGRGHSTELRYAPVRVRCPRCNAAPVEMVAWADPYQRQTRRLQRWLAVEAASMSVMRVAALHGLSWLNGDVVDLHGLQYCHRTNLICDEPEG